MPNITTNRAITYANNIVVQTLSLMQSQMDQMSVDLLNMVNAQFLDLRKSDRHWHECCQKTTLQYHKICLVFKLIMNSQIVCYSMRIHFLIFFQ